jgi:ketosteroid isomerase-like protein
MPLLPPPEPPARRHRGRRGIALGGALVAVAAAATALGIAGGGGAGAGRSTAPLSDGDVRGVAEEFAKAYQDEDGAALGRLLTADVQRVLPAGIARGRSRVVTEYERQFRANDTRGYELQNLEVHGGRVGRASGGYRVDRDGRKAIEGRIVLSMVRDGGRPRIGLIAVTPSS